MYIYIYRIIYNNYSNNNDNITNNDDNDNDNNDNNDNNDDLLQLVDRFLFHGRFTAFLNAEMAQWAQLSAA